MNDEQFWEAVAQAETMDEKLDLIFNTPETEEEAK